jgi:hypothetical protein
MGGVETGFVDFAPRLEAPWLPWEPRGQQVDNKDGPLSYRRIFCSRLSRACCLQQCLLYSPLDICCVLIM